MEELINYLIVKNLEDKDFVCNPNIRVKSAYILAKKQMMKMTEEEKADLLKKIKNGTDGGT
tara:strand:+ start:280 stop:462 length:183 start_codon:yes stop_codon:yes gene_type:complete